MRAPGTERYKQATGERLPMPMPSGNKPGTGNHPKATREPAWPMAFDTPYGRKRPDSMVKATAPDGKSYQIVHPDDPAGHTPGTQIRDLDHGKLISLMESGMSKEAAIRYLYGIGD